MQTDSRRATEVSELLGQGPRPWIWLLPEVTLVTTLFPNVLHADMPVTAIKINKIIYSFYTLEKLAHVIFSHFLVFYSPTTAKRNIVMTHEYRKIWDLQNNE